MCYRGKTLGVVGYGSIGQETATLARAFKMKIVALRRRKELSQHDKDIHLKVICTHAVLRFNSFKKTQWCCTTGSLSV